MRNKIDKELLQLIADNNGTIRKQNLYAHFDNDVKQYREAVSRLTTQGLIAEDRAVFKLTPKGYR